MCWRADQKRSSESEGGLRGVALFCFCLGVLECWVFFILFWVVCLFVVSFFFPPFSDADRSWEDLLVVVYFQPVLYWLEIASTRQSPIAQAI